MYPSNGNTIKLPELLEQFREALEDEIELVKRSSSSNAIPLTNGKKLARVAGGYQYTFNIDSILNIPDGTPGYLVIDDRQLDVSIIALEGLKLVISISCDLGSFIPYATLQSDLSILMIKLIARIEQLSTELNPAADRMLGKTEPNVTLPKSIETSDLNFQQYKALQYSLGSELTFIWGPPGTGKTHTIGAIAKELYKESRSLLLVSHTNTAVDQALEKISIHLKDEIPKGLIVRLGEPKANRRGEKSTFKYPEEIILKHQVEKRAKELTDERTQLVSDKDKLIESCNILQNKISILDWINSAKPDIDSLGEDLGVLKEDERKRDTLEIEYLSKQQDRISIEKDGINAKECIAAQNDVYELTTKIDETKKRIIKNKRLFSTLVTQISYLRSDLTIMHKIEPLRDELSRMPAAHDQENIIESILAKTNNFKAYLDEKNNQLSSEQKTLNLTLTTSPLMRIWKRLPKPEKQQNIVDKLTNDISNLENHLLSCEQKLNGARLLLAKMIDLNQIVEPYKHLTSLAEISTELKKKSVEFEKLKICLRNDISEAKAYKNNLTDSMAIVNNFADRYGKAPEEIISDVEKKLSSIKALHAKYNQMQDACCKARNSIEKDLTYKLECLKAWSLIDEIGAKAEDMYESLLKAYNKTLDNYGFLNIDQLKEEYSAKYSQIEQINERIERINEKLKNVEKDIIANALIVASTLAKSYLDDNVQERKFDTIILDEASMAPIPALWVAACLCEKNVVIIGDFKQLPPIVLSEKDITKQWLGRDIFEASGVMEKYYKGIAPDYFIALMEERRLPPQICSIAKELFYDGKLINKIDLSKLDEINIWYNEKWAYSKSYVLLVDTASVNAWVTSVTRGRNSSRMNFLSASICLDIAEKLLKKERPTRNENDPHRIFIISPYHAHSKLLRLMIKERGLENDINADTVHGFQGREAEIVIFDLVADEPHWRVNLFIPKYDEATQRLLNVALTRPKNRLIIVGNFDYCRKKGKNVFLGSRLIPFLIEKAKFKKVDAKDVVTGGLAERAAHASLTVFGGPIEKKDERIVVTQEAFYRYLYDDISSAKKRIIIYSAFITKDRLSKLEVHLRSVIEGPNHAKIFVVTKALQERTKLELVLYDSIEKHLRALGVHIIHKLRMHEKLIFIDDNILWSGSLNPLSYSSTQEVMERRISHEVFNDYAKALRLEELIAIANTPAEKCPICDDEMIAVEGAKDPFYWMCVKGKTCFTRSIDQPHPSEGLFSCTKCSAPYEFHFTKRKPIWRCTVNKRHYIRMFKSHLRLPKMVELIPRNELKKVHKYFGI